MQPGAPRTGGGGDNLLMHASTFALVAAVSLVACAGPTDRPLPRARDTDVDADFDADADADADADDEGGGAFLSGRLCDRHVGAFVVGADVVAVDEAGVEVRDVTDEAGFFVVEVAGGTQIVSIRGQGFQRTFVVEAVVGADVSVALDTDCVAE